MEHDKPRKRWLVKSKNKTALWKPVDFFASAEEAAAFVGGKDTGESDWDKFPHRKEDFELSKWQPNDID